MEQHVTLDIIYQHILILENKLANLEGLIGIKEETLSAAELKEHKETLERMRQGKEGISFKKRGLSN